VVEGATGGARDDERALRLRRAAPREFGRSWMVNNGYTPRWPWQAVASGRADLVSLRPPFIANPDLGRRLRENAPWNALTAARFYGGGAAGYTDYPALAASMASGRAAA
jgi:N-ethylmaleimide reductase